jgi:cell division septum initiation protein DivIVA
VADEQHTHPDTETLLKRLIDIVNNAKPLPMSTTVRIAKDEVLELLEDALDRLPEELRQARWMLKERAEFLAKTQRDATDILEQARVRAERMVQRTEIVREAAHTAQRLVDDAKSESSRLRLEAEDYCDQKLAAFEIVLERTLKTVQAGREKLRVSPLPPGSGVLGLEEGEGGEGDDGFFDQDVR